MVPFLLTAREHHAVPDAVAYREKHAAAIAARQKRGARYVVHDDPTPVAARVSAGSWVVDCLCGAGNAVDPAWPVAYCFGCGAVHAAVRFPADIDAITAALLQRPDPRTRHWTPGDTVNDVRRDNLANGLG